jgi:hypothetical protein
MFGFAPPPAPAPAPTPCPQCGGSDAVLIYATVRVEYLRCACCRQVRTIAVDNHAIHGATG